MTLYSGMLDDGIQSLLQDGAASGDWEAARAQLLQDFGRYDTVLPSTPSPLE